MRRWLVAVAVLFAGFAVAQVVQGSNASVPTAGPNGGFGTYDSRDPGMGLQVMVNKVGMTYMATDPCAQVASIVGGLHGPAAFCLGPDGGSIGTQADGGPLLTFTAYPLDGGGPVTGAYGRCPNGPECDPVVFQSYDGGGSTTGVHEYRSANVAAPVGDFSCYTVGRQTHIAGNQTWLSRINLGRIWLYGAANQVAINVSYPDAGQNTIAAVAGSVVAGGWLSYAFVFDSVADDTSTLNLYSDGVVVGTPVTTAPSQINQQANLPFEVGSRISGTDSNLTGDMLFLACSEAAWTSAQVAAIARSFRTNWSGMYGEPISFSRASTAYCPPGDGGYGTWLRSGEPCLVGGTYLSEPSAKNEILNNATFSGWTLASDANKDGGPPNADGGHNDKPTVTANGCPYAAPDGTMTAALVCWPAIEDLAASPSGSSRLSSTTFTGTAVPWTDSVYIHAADASDGGTVWVTDTAAAHGTPVSVGWDAGATWTREKQTWTLSAAAHNLVFGPYLPGTQPASQPSLCACLWIPQAELGSVATSPIVNAGTALTRAATVATVPNPLSGTGPTDWCFESRFTSPNDPAAISNGNFLDLGAYNSANSARLSMNGTTGKGRLDVYDSAATNAAVATTSVITFPVLLAACFTPTNAALYVGGVKASADVATNGIATQPSTVYLGTNSGSILQPNGYGSAWRSWTGGYRSAP
jgi:hypothetical protein